MENTNDVLSDLKDIASGLKRIGKNRKVVLPHHKEFELIEELEGIAAGAIAKSLRSRRLLLMTNVEGVLNKEKKLIEEISSSEILEMIKNETITGGMIPKINTCLDAVNNGVTGVVIVDGRKPHSILFELFSDKGAGTLIRK